MESVVMLQALSKHLFLLGFRREVEELRREESYQWSLAGDASLRTNQEPNENGHSSLY